VTFRHLTGDYPSRPRQKENHATVRLRGLHNAGMRTLHPPSAGRLHLFGVSITFDKDFIDDVCGLEDADAVVAICF